MGCKSTNSQFIVFEKEVINKKIIGHILIEEGIEYSILRVKDLTGNSITFFQYASYQEAYSKFSQLCYSILGDTECH